MVGVGTVGREAAKTKRRKNMKRRHEAYILRMS